MHEYYSATLQPSQKQDYLASLKFRYGSNPCTQKVGISRGLAHQYILSGTRNDPYTERRGISSDRLKSSIISLSRKPSTR